MKRHPITMAIRALRAANVAFEPSLYAYQPHGGTYGSKVTFTLAPESEPLAE